eukprot:scaffold1154_cov310-Pinguiococcus_pyrenoidosus.AAC.23
MPAERPSTVTSGSTVAAASTSSSSGTPRIAPTMSLSVRCASLSWPPLLTMAASSSGVSTWRDDEALRAPEKFWSRPAQPTWRAARSTPHACNSTPVSLADRDLKARSNGDVLRPEATSSSLLSSSTSRAAWMAHPPCTPGACSACTSLPQATAPNPSPPLWEPVTHSAEAG